NLPRAPELPSTNPPQLLLSNPNLAMIVSGGQTRPNSSQVQIRGNMAGAETLFLWCNRPRGAFGGGGVVNTGVKAAINVAAPTGKIDPNPITLTVGETKQVTLSCSTQGGMVIGPQMFGNPAIATIAGGGQNSATTAQIPIHGNTLGTTALNLMCPAPNGQPAAAGTAPITVMQARNSISPNPITLNIGETKQVTLTCVSPGSIPMNPA